MTYTLSPSSLNLLKDCPRCFWVHHNKGIKRPDAAFPSLPAGMDRILKEHFDRFMEKGTLPPELVHLNSNGLKLFSNKEFLKTCRDARRGIQWKDEKGNIFKGAVDNILEKNGKLIVLDYKTRGFPVKEDSHEHYRDQIDIYNFLLRKNGFDTEDYGYLLFFHPKNVLENGDVEFHKDLKEIKVSIINAERIFKKAIEILEGDMPKPSENCEFCKWNSNIRNDL